MRRNWLPRLVGALVGSLCALSASAVDVFTDIEYASPGHTQGRNFLDVYVPTGGASDGTPTVLFIHGGGWVGGDKGGAPGYFGALNDAGYAVVSCNYTLSVPAAGFAAYPQNVIDVKSVVRWIRAEGGAYGLSRRIVVSGGSAGGHLAMMVGTTAGVSMFEPLPSPGGYRVQGFVNLWGPSDLVWHAETFDPNIVLNLFLVPYLGNEPLYAQGSPISHVSQCDPPAAFLMGLSDPLVPIEHATRMVDEMESLGLYTTLRTTPGGHGFGPWGGDAVVGGIVAGLIPALLANQYAADIDGNEIINTQDIILFLNAFTAGEPEGDFNNDGFLNTADVIAYLNAYAARCAPTT